MEKEQWQPKQGEKVLVRDNGDSYWETRLYVLKYKDIHYVSGLYEEDNGLYIWDEIKPFKEEIEIGDWVRNYSRMFKVELHHSTHEITKKGYKKITNPQLIELLENEIK